MKVRYSKFVPLLITALQELNNKVNNVIPEPPKQGKWVLQSIDGVMQWVEVKD